MPALPRRVRRADPAFCIELNGPRTPERIAEAQQTFTPLLDKATPLFRYWRNDQHSRDEMVRWRLPQADAEAMGFPKTMTCPHCAADGVHAELHTSNFEFDTPMRDVAYYFNAANP